MQQAREYPDQIKLHAETRD